MTKDEALKLALEALESLQGGCTDSDDGTFEAITVWCPEVIDAIREALAQPEFVLNGIDCSCGRKWRVFNNILTASEQPEQESDDLTIAYLSGFYDGANKYAPQRNPEVE